MVSRADGHSSRATSPGMLLAPPSTRCRRLRPSGCFADAVRIRQRGCSRVVAQQHQGARALPEQVGILQSTLMRAAREGPKPRVPPQLASRVFDHALGMLRNAFPATFVGVSSGVTSRDVQIAALLTSIYAFTKSTGQLDRRPFDRNQVEVASAWDNLDSKVLQFSVHVQLEESEFDALSRSPVLPRGRPWNVHDWRGQEG